MKKESEELAAARIIFFSLPPFDKGGNGGISAQIKYRCGILCPKYFEPHTTDPL